MLCVVSDEVIYNSVAISGLQCNDLQTRKCSLSSICNELKELTVLEHILQYRLAFMCRDRISGRLEFTLSDPIRRLGNASWLANTYETWKPLFLPARSPIPNCTSPLLPHVYLLRFFPTPVSNSTAPEWLCKFWASPPYFRSHHCQ